MRAPAWRRRAAVPTEAATAFHSARAVVIHGAQGLAGLPPAVGRSLAAEFGVQALSDRICPVELADGSVALFALAGHVAGDQADELARRIVARGRRMADPPRYVLSAALLLALSRGETEGRTSDPHERTP